MWLQECTFYQFIGVVLTAFVLLVAISTARKLPPDG